MTEKFIIKNDKLNLLKTLAQLIGSLFKIERPN